jgi:predicted nucleotidyltransferase
MVVTSQHLDHITRRAKDFGATQVILFGSALTNPEDARDIDIATDVPLRDIDLFAGLLEHELHCLIDAVPLQHSEHPFIQYIIRKGKRIL